MSLIQTVIDLIEQLGPMSGVQMLARCPGYSQKQVFQALQNAKFAGRLEIVEKSQPRGFRHGGKTPAVYGPGKRRPALVTVTGPRPVNSVFELGARL